MRNQPDQMVDFKKLVKKQKTKKKTATTKTILVIHSNGSQVGKEFTNVVSQHLNENGYESVCKGDLKIKKIYIFFHYY